VRIYTDEIINAICLNMADRRGVSPTDVEVQLSWEEEYGFTAEVWVKGRSQFILESNILEAIEQYMIKQYNKRVFRSNITLDADEEFWADITEEG
jgi:hypothetical protein